MIAGQPSRPPAFTFRAEGHPAVSATHSTTLELTTEERLTHEGDCIVAVAATCGLQRFPGSIQQALSTTAGRATMTILVRGEIFTVEGQGSPALTFTHPQEIVIRKSSFTSDRTLMIHADAAAKDVPRKMVKLLRIRGEPVSVEVRILP
jgi:hypothetical protein